MFTTAKVTGGTRLEPTPGLMGVRAAMYGEMAANATGNRPWWGGKNEWDAALVGAIQFVEKSGLDELTSRALLEEAAETRMAGDLSEWDTTAAEVCTRLAAEFRWHAHQQVASHR